MNPGNIMARLNHGALLNAVQGELSGVACTEKNAVMQMLQNINPGKLSRTERSALFEAIRQMAGNDVVDRQELATIKHMISQFAKSSDSPGAPFGWANGPMSGQKFDAQADQLLDSMRGPNARLVAFALGVVGGDALSSRERQSFMATMKAFASDGDISSKDAAALLNLLQDFDERGLAGLKPFWPFAQINLGHVPVNPLQATLNGLLAQENAMTSSGGGHNFVEYLTGRIQSAQPGFARDSLLAMLPQVNLSLLDKDERLEIFMLASSAGRDGRISNAEAGVIFKKLLEAQTDQGGVSSSPCISLPQNIPEWRVDQSGGRAQIDLGNHLLSLNENNSEIIITNKATGEKSRIWGDPHFDLNGDGKNDVDFKGTLSLNLDDGTKITINTTSQPGNEGVTYASKLTITNGSQALTVSGLDELTKGDLKIVEGKSGHVLDALTGDGLNLYESSRGQGWLVNDGFWMRPVNQKDMDRNDKAISDFSLPDALKALSLTSMIASSTLERQLMEMFG